MNYAYITKSLRNVGAAQKQRGSSAELRVTVGEATCSEALGMPRACSPSTCPPVCCAPLPSSLQVAATEATYSEALELARAQHGPRHGMVEKVKYEYSAFLGSTGREVRRWRPWEISLGGGGGSRSW